MKESDETSGDDKRWSQMMREYMPIHLFGEVIRFSSDGWVPTSAEVVVIRAAGRIPLQRTKSS